MTNSQRYEMMEDRKPRLATCHKCAKHEPEVDLVACANVFCERHVCCNCATELEYELEACAEHAYGLFTDMRDMYRNSLRRMTAEMMAADEKAMAAEERMAA